MFIELRVVFFCNSKPEKPFSGEFTVTGLRPVLEPVLTGTSTGSSTGLRPVTVNSPEKGFSGSELPVVKVIQSNLY